jgi:hypothetical protein
VTGLGDFQENVWLVETRTKGDSAQEIVFSAEDAEGFDHFQRYVRADRVGNLEAAIRGEIAERRERSDRNNSMVHWSFADALQEILDQHGVGRP